MKRIGVLLLVAAGLLAGCSSTGRNYVESAMAETLEVEVLPNQSKMFTYRLRWPEEQIPNHIRVSRDGRDTRREFYQGGVNINRNTPERLLQNTAYVVERAGYCREGFFELDRSVSRYHLWVRGECKESATDADAKAFAGKQVLTPERWGKPAK